MGRIHVDPRAAAQARAGGGFDVRVLEPSPPTVRDGPWFADDPVAIEPRARDLPLVSPVPGPDVDITWDELAAERPELAEWCADRWLGAWRRLPALPPIGVFTATRTALHQVATDVVSPPREAANGKIGLRYTYRGFGTPFFADDRQVRVERTDLVTVHGDEVTRAPLPPALDRDATIFLADWYGFAASVLETARAEAASDGEASSRVQLWPEHFDMSVDLGDEAQGTKGTFGASPGDDAHPEPYLYVTHWAPVPSTDFWNDASFGGASMPLAALVATADQRGAALEFVRQGRLALMAQEL
jgi:hypothetical protein